MLILCQENIFSAGVVPTHPWSQECVRNWIDQKIRRLWNVSACNQFVAGRFITQHLLDVKGQNAAFIVFDKLFESPLGLLKLPALEVADQCGRIDILGAAFTQHARTVSDKHFPFPGHLDAQLLHA